MSTPIRIKRSAVSGKRPQLTDLQLGELALNTNDGSLFTERDTGGVGIATTVSNLTPWTESYGASSISYLNSVGIGTNNPQFKLDVNGSVNATAFIGNGAYITGISTTNIIDYGVGLGGGSIAGVNTTGTSFFNHLNISGISTFKDDVIFAGANYNIRFDKSTDDLIFDDNAKLKFGIGSTTVSLFYKPDTRDFRHEFDGGANYVLLTNTFDLKDANGSNELITAFGNNGTDNYVKLSHNGNARLRTNGIGVTVYGQLDTTTLNVTDGIAGITTFENASSGPWYPYNTHFKGKVGITSSLVVYVDNLADYQKGVEITAPYYHATQKGGFHFSGDGYNSYFMISDYAFNIANNVGIDTIASFEIFDRRVTFDSSVIVGQGLHVTGISTFNSNINITGDIISTGNVYIDADIDVDGHTNLDNISVAGVSTFTGDATFSGNVSVAGTLTYEDVTNIDSVGIVTARKDVHVGAGLSVVGISTFSDTVHIPENISLKFGGNLPASKLNIGYDVTGGVNALTLGASLYVSDLTTNNRFILNNNGNLEFCDTSGNTKLEVNNTGINVSGIVTSTSFSGDGSNLTNLTGASAGTYGNSTAVPQIVIDANGRITGITNVSVAGGGGGGGSSIIIKDSGSLVGTAGTIDFGSNLNVSPLSSGIVTVTGSASGITGINTTGTSFFDQLYVSGVSTFSENIDANGDLDVDGHTNLDNVSVAGVSTFSSSAGNIVISDDGPSLTFISTSGIQTSNRYRLKAGGGRLYLQVSANDGASYAAAASIGGIGNIFIPDDDKVFFGTNSDAYIQHDNSDLNIVNTNGNIDVTGNVLLNNDLDVDGHTNLDNLSVAGVSTFTGDAQFDGNVSIGGTLTYEDVTNIDSVGIITAQSDVHVGAGLSVVGVSTFSDNINVTGILTATSFSGSGANITGISTTNITDYGVGFGEIAGIDTTGISYFYNVSIDNHATVQNGNLTVLNGDLYVNDKIYHYGDLDTYIRFDTNNIKFNADGNERLKIVSSGAIATGILSVTNLDVSGSLDVNQSVRRSVQTNTRIDLIDNGIQLKTGGTAKLSLSGDDVSVVGVLTASSFVGSGASLTALPTLANSKLVINPNYTSANTYTVWLAARYNVNWEHYVIDSGNFGSGVSADRTGNISGNDVDININVGDTLILDLATQSTLNNAAGPTSIKTTPGTGTGNRVTNPTATNNGSSSQNITWTPTVAGTYYYQNESRVNMVGQIIVSAGTSAPANRFISDINFNSEGRVTGVVTFNGYTAASSSTRGIVQIDTNNLTVNAGIVSVAPNLNLPSGVITASSFVGSGASITGISTNNITDYGVGLGGGGSSLFSQTSAGIHTLSKVGIGTTDPEFDLDLGSYISQNVSTASTLRIIGDANSTAIRIGPGAASRDITVLRVDSRDGTTDGDNSTDLGHSIKYMGTGSGADNRLAFWPDNLSGTKFEAFTIYNDGKVLVDDGVNGGHGFYGTPTNQFTVRGSSKFDSINSTGIVTASSFVGNGANITGISTTNITDYGVGLGGGGATGVSTTVGTFTVSAGTTAIIDSFPYASNNYKVAEYTLHFENGSNIQAQKLLVMQDQSNVYSNSYGVMASSNLLVSVGSSIGNGNVYINVVPEVGVSGTTTYRWRREVQE